MRAFSDGEFSASAALFVRNWTRNVRTPDVLSFVTSSEARSSNSLSQPNRLSSPAKLILLTSRIRAHTGPLDVGPVVTPKIAGFSEAEDVHFCPPSAWQCCITLEDHASARFAHVRESLWIEI